MSRVVLDIPDDTLLALRIQPDNAGDELRMSAAVKLYELRRLSSGAAAKLAGVPKTVFLTRLADYGVNTFFQTEEELKQEASLA